MGTSATSEAAAARRAVRLILGATVLASGVTGCGDAGVPDRAPDVTGVVSGADAPGGPVLADPADDYFAGMPLLRGDPVVVGDRDGDRITPSGLRDGDEVEVWIEGGCEESFPVRCTVVALRVHP